MSQPYIQPSRIGMKSLTTWHKAEFVKSVKMAALQQDMTINEFVEHALLVALGEPAPKMPAEDDREIPG